MLRVRGTGHRLMVGELCRFPGRFFLTVVVQVNHAAPTGSRVPVASVHQNPVSFELPLDIYEFCVIHIGKTRAMSNHRCFDESNHRVSQQGGYKLPGVLSRSPEQQPMCSASGDTCGWLSLWYILLFSSCSSAISRRDLRQATAVRARVANARREASLTL
jgi:hypothetical protein